MNSVVSTSGALDWEGGTERRFANILILHTTGGHCVLQMVVILAMGPTPNGNSQTIP